MVGKNKFPTDWEIDILGHCVRIETGSRNTEDKKDNGKYPFFVRSQKVEHIDTYNYDCEAVLTAGDGVGTGKVFHYYNGKFDVHQRVYVLSEFDKVIGRYLYYYFKMNFLKEVEKYTAKSSVDSVRRDMIAKMQVPIPSTREQSAISVSLSDVDNLIASLQKLIDKKKYIKQGTMQELLTGKTRLSKFEKSWIKVRLGDHCNIFDGTHQTPHYVESGIPFYSVENVTANNFINTKYISEEEHKQLIMKCQIEKGDILMTRIGSIGVCKYIDWNVDASFYVSLALIKCIGQIDAQFLCYYANSNEFKKEIKTHSLLTAIPQKINLEPISEIIITIPKSIEEQKAIVQILSDMDKEIEQLEKKLAKYQQIKQGMMQELLTGHIRLVESAELSQTKTQIIKEKSSQNHNQHFDDAVMIAGIVNSFYSDKYPLGRKKMQKLLYLLRRKEQADISSFHKKAAGPYADTVRYKGGEPIAKKNKYIVESKSKIGSCFSKGENIQQALTYLKEWNKQQDIEWLISEFRYTKVDELELLATVDMAMCDLSQEGRLVTVQAIKDLIQSTKEWRNKLKKTYFSDSDIQRAVVKCREMFKEVF